MLVDAFLNANGWGDADQVALAGDASARRYIRLCSGPKRAILMIDPQGDIARFAMLSAHLASIGLSAPRIHARSDDLMLLEDFGDAQFARVVAKDLETETTLYTVATDVLCAIETKAVPPELATATPKVLGQMIEPAFTHYLALFGVTPGERARRITEGLTELLDKHVSQESVLVLRDFHAENMIWLPDRTGVRRVGLLDFQDALAGPPVYDLVSMLQDARRDVSNSCHKATLRHYLDASGRTEEDVMAAFHLLGLQRNLRILGIFARLAQERGKPAYLALVPRVWAHFRTSLAAPVARSLEPLVLDLFPEPTADRLNPEAR